ncbi:STAS domain-containing protein [Rhodoferax antarcticus]|uniref:Anti-sigma-factor antagonist (STAS) domain-containing protein n=1 Tax=Rhodoferax antarcticus ANT.BR TaxID=1111071 RepID=A0A1Q8YKU4_9BURK|nr:STAS domain-containing protein [Rhodoferax antarcticus]APW47472.1 anti-anti-sigma factor [Rhodoferax antarcticus]MCW2311765.1 phospholipid transport system transporter-binding protein [Rhodoferax antarcticus]OLP08605.1 anti-sigma-factor antagonist (STAS) domain-containing protein [Rhodoferax antarcticus ANT.BR]
MLKLPALLTQATASTCLRELSAALPNQPEAVVVDASGLSRFDSAALAVLLSLRRGALGLGKSFAVSELPQRMADLARLYGIAELLPATAGAALAAESPAAKSLPKK